MGLKNIGIEAGAGCGKTTRITEDIIEGLERGDFNIDNIVAITFTRKAANELRSRISLKLQEAIGKGDARLEDELKNIGNARISTIHSFCEGLLKERPVEAGVDPGFSVIDETGQGEFLDEVFGKWLKKRLEQNPQFFRELVIDVGKGLKPSEYSYVDNSFQGIVKTALGHRELDLFFPEKPESPNTIIKQFIRTCRDLKKQVEAPKLSDYMDNYIQRLQVDFTKDQEDYFAGISDYKPGNLGGASSKDLRNEWKEVCGEYVHKIKYAIRYPELKRLYENTNKEVMDFIAYYREAMRERGVMDFDEILYKTERLLAYDKGVRNYFKNKLSYIFLDEFQDTDPLQVKILFYLAEKKGKSADTWEDVELEEGKIYVVGDPKQSVFRFRRADIEMYSTAMDKITGGKKDYLSQNYRSAKRIIKWVNDFFQDRIKKPADGNYQAEYVPLEHHKKSEGDVLFVEPDIPPAEIESQKKDEAREIEAKLTASWIKEWTAKEKFAFDDIMVLFKTKANMQTTAGYLEELEIPYEMVGARSYFGRGEVLDMANLLMALANPLDQVSIVAALKGPFFSLTDKDLYVWRLNGGRFDYRMADENSSYIVGKALSELSSLHRKSFKSTADTILKNLIEDKGVLASYMASYRGRQKVLNILKAVELLKSFGKIPFCNAVDAFAERLEQNVEMADFAPRTGESDAVQLLTIHKAKGLEQKVVYLADCTSNNIVGNEVFIDNAQERVIYKLNPGYETPEYFSWKDSDRLRDEAESERLRYVAATRAKDLLVINRVLFKGFDKTFVAPFFNGVQKTKTVKINVSSLTLTPGKKPGEPVPKSTAIFEKELKRIREDIPKTLEAASQPSLLVQSPSTAEGHKAEIKVEIVYDQASADFRIEDTMAATVGLLAHKLMEIDPANIETAARTLIQNEKAKTQASELVRIVESLRKKDLQERLGKAKTVLREVPLKFRSKDGVYYDGRIDLLFEEDDGWVLVDYKAIIIANEEEEKRVQQKYKGQLQIYAKGLKQIGINVKECLIVSC